MVDELEDEPLFTAGVDVFQSGLIEAGADWLRLRTSE